MYNKTGAVVFLITGIIDCSMSCQSNNQYQLEKIRNCVIENKFTFGAFEEITSATMEERLSRVNILNRDMTQFAILGALGHCKSQSQSTDANLVT